MQEIFIRNKYIIYIFIDLCTGLSDFLTNLQNWRYTRSFQKYCCRCVKVMYGWFRFSILALCRLVSVIYCLIMVGTHILLSRVPVAKVTLQLYHPALTAVMFFITGMLHLLKIIEMVAPSFNCCGCFAFLFQKCKREKSAKTAPDHPICKGIANVVSSLKTFWKNYLGEEGRFGRRGQNYEYRLMLRELFEIPSQSYQGYLMSTRISSTIMIDCYTAVIIVDCILVPVIMGLKTVKGLRKRNMVLLLDMLVDTFLGAVFPSLLLFQPVQEFFAYPGIQASLLWTAKAISHVKYVMVTSGLDLFSTLLPVVMSHSLIDTVHNLWMDIESQKGIVKVNVIENTNGFESYGIVPIKRQGSLERVTERVVQAKTNADVKLREKIGLSLKACTEKTLAVLSLVWAVVLIVQVSRAPYLTSCDHGIRSKLCIRQVHPWLGDANSCHCHVILYDCNLVLANGYSQMVSFHAIGDVIHREFASTAPLVVHFRNCPALTSLPASIEAFKNAHFIVTENSGVKDPSLNLPRFPRLVSYTFRKNPIRYIPPTLQQVPKSIYFLKFEDCQLEELPKWIHHAWRHVPSIYINNNHFQEFPNILLDMPALKEINLGSNNISIIPTSISKLKDLRTLRLANNSIRSIPPELKSLSLLQTVTLSANNITTLDDLPWTSTEIKNWTPWPKGLFTLDYNPVCKLAILSTSSACRIGCSSTCDIALETNRRCDLECFSEACDFDNQYCNVFIKTL